MGPAIATQILLNSDLKNRFHLLHLDTRINSVIRSMGSFGFGKIFRNIRIYQAMIRLCRKEKPDLILIPISQTTIGFLKDAGFIWIAAFFKCKVVVQLRGSNFKNWQSSASFLTRFMVKKTLARTTGVMVLGRMLKYLFADHYHPERIFVVPNGGNYSIPIRQRESDEFRILYLANLFSSKGVEDVFLALVHLKKISDFKFSADFIGEWVSDETKRFCLELVRQHELPVRIHNSGVSESKFSYLANADVFVFPPREPEGQPWSITEAMAASLPVIATDQGAITESVIDSVNGFIVPVRTPETIAEKLKLLIEDSELRNRFSMASRRLYEENLTEERMVDNYTKVFEQLTIQN